MKRIIVAYNNLTEDILNLLIEKYPDGYENNDIIVFKNAKNETIKAVEVKTADTDYLVKVSKQLATTMESYEDDGDFESSIDDNYTDSF
jgi:DNA-directed RNA polymerase subunit delta